MCAPCKVVINNGFTGAADRAKAISGQMRQHERGEIGAVTEDDDLYALAEAEVVAIEAVRKAGVAMAERVGAPPRWIALMERL